MDISKIDITSIEFLDEYQINIYLSNGHRIVYNMKPKMNTMRFSEVFALGKFETASIVNGQIIRWAGNIELTLDEIMHQVVRV